MRLVELWDEEVAFLSPFQADRGRVCQAHECLPDIVDAVLCPLIVRSQQKRKVDVLRMGRRVVFLTNVHHVQPIIVVLLAIVLWVERLSDVI